MPERIERVVRRVNIVTVIAPLGFFLAILVAVAVVIGARDDQQQRCEAGNSVRADVRELAGTTASGFSELANIIVGDEPRTPEEQARIDTAREQYDARVVAPLSDLADAAGSLAPRDCP